MTELLTAWEGWESRAVAREAVERAVREKNWDVFGLELPPIDDRILWTEDEDGIHLYLKEMSQ